MAAIDFVNVLKLNNKNFPHNFMVFSDQSLRSALNG